MSKSLVPEKFLEDHLLDNDTKSAAVYFFIYRYILSDYHGAINFIELAQYLGVGTTIDEDEPHYRELSSGVSENSRYWSIRSWAHYKTLEDELTTAVKHLFANVSRERSTHAQHKVLSFFIATSNLIDEGVSIQELLSFFKTNFSNALFKVDTDTYETSSKLIGELISFQTINTTTTSVLDPACKSGGFLIPTLSHANPKKVSVNAIEGDASAGLMTEALLRANGANPKNLNFDSKIDQLFGDMQKFDMVVCNPPFKKISKSFINPEMYYQLGLDTHTRSEVAYLKLGLSKLNHTGRAVFVLPSIILDSEKYIELRGQLIENFGLHTVVLLPDDIFQHARVSTCLLMFDKEKTHDSICFVDTNGLADNKTGQDPFSSKAIEEIVSLVRDKPSIIEGLAKTIFTIDITEEYRLNPKNYLKTSKVESLLNQYEDFRNNYLDQISELDHLQRELENLAHSELSRGDT